MIETGIFAKKKSWWQIYARHVSSSRRKQMSGSMKKCWDPGIEILIAGLIVTASAPLPQDGEVIYKDWVFINYTFKRFEGLTQRGTPTKK